MDGLPGGAEPAGFETWAGFSVISTLSFVLGFAMNYGSICTFIATTELVSERRPARFLALAECAVWAAVGYIMLDTLPTLHAGWSPLLHMVCAAILFGVGVYVNGACIFGSVGHFGNGDLEFGFTFLGILVVLSLDLVLELGPEPMPISAAPPLALGALLMVLPAFLFLRLGVSFKSETNFRRLTLAMGTIGITSATLSEVAPRFSIHLDWIDAFDPGDEFAHFCLHVWRQSRFGENSPTSFFANLADMGKCIAKDNGRDADGLWGAPYPWWERHPAACRPPDGSVAGLSRLPSYGSGACRADRWIWFSSAILVVTFGWPAPLKLCWSLARHRGPVEGLGGACYRPAQPREFEPRELPQECSA